MVRSFQFTFEPMTNELTGSRQPIPCPSKFCPQNCQTQWYKNDGRSWQDQHHKTGGKRYAAGKNYNQPTPQRRAVFSFQLLRVQDDLSLQIVGRPKRTIFQDQRPDTALPLRNRLRISLANSTTETGTRARRKISNQSKPNCGTVLKKISLVRGNQSRDIWRIPDSTIAAKR